MKYIFNFTVFFLINWENYAQKLDAAAKVGVRSIEGANQTANVFNLFDERYEGWKNNQYLNSDWLFGDLFSETGKVLRKNVPLKFDAFNNEIIMKRPDGDTVAVYPAVCKIFYENGTELLNLTQINGLKSKKGEDLSRKYVINLFSGKTKLIKYFRKEIELADYKGAYSANRPYDSFKGISEYFFMDENGKISNLKLSKNQLLKVLINHKQEIKNYIKINKLNISSETGLLSVFTYFDSLI